MSTSSADAPTPSGVGGWLLLLTASLLAIGPLANLLFTLGQFASAELRYPPLKNFDEWAILKLLTWITVIAGSIYSAYCGYGLLTRNDPGAVKNVRIGIWIIGPIGVATTGILLPTMTLGFQPEFLQSIGGVIGSALSAWIWTLYLRKSVRVRNTYGLFQRSSEGTPSHSSSRTPIPTEPPQPADLPVSANAAIDDATAVQSTGAKTALNQSAPNPAGMFVPAISLPHDRAMRPIDALPKFDERPAYETIAEEIESGRQDKGLWLQAFVRSAGDPVRQKLIYVEARIEGLRNQFVLQQQAADLKQKEERRVAGENAKREEEFHALMAAISTGEIAEVRRRLESDIDLEQVNESGLTPLQLAIQLGNEKIIKLLSPEVTPRVAELIQRFRSGSNLFNSELEEIATSVLTKRADPDLRARTSGMTLLHVAVDRNLPDVVSTLLRAGCHRGLRDARGLTAHDLAVRLGHVLCEREFGRWAPGR